MPRIVLGIEYDGAAFAGWQRQHDRRNVQACVEEAVALEPVPDRARPPEKRTRPKRTLLVLAGVVVTKVWFSRRMGSAGEGKNTAHQTKKLIDEDVRAFRDRFAVPLSDEDVAQLRFLKPDADTALSIYTHLQERLAPFKRIRRLEFVKELPKTISGKIRRVELRRRRRSRRGSAARATPAPRASRARRTPAWPRRGKSLARR